MYSNGQNGYGRMADYYQNGKNNYILLLNIKLIK